MNVIKTQYLRGLNLESVPQIIESVSGGINGGCNLYIGKTTSSITVKNISGDEVEFANPIEGSILPFSVTEIVSVNGEMFLVALW